MIIKNSNYHISNLYNEIQTGELDLRPNFQRGEVWPSSKKKLLIDSILREWYVPPIHTVVLNNGTAEVLDGQQRLTAIKDFIDNKFQVDGNIEPYDEEINKLHKLRYSDLPSDAKRKVDRFEITLYQIINYNLGEPNELFFRLNQTVKLTSSESRNAIFGEVRDDITSFVKLMIDNNVDKNILGFSNSRMAYNDLLSRVCLLLEQKTIRYQLTDSNLNLRYRDSQSFDNVITNSISETISILGRFTNLKKEIDLQTNLTKASSLSWIYLIANLISSGHEFDETDLFESFSNLEVARNAIKTNEDISLNALSFFNINEDNLRELILIYIERSSSRVMSIGSIIIRDIIQCFSCYKSSMTIKHLDDDVQKMIVDFSLALENKTNVKYLIEELSEKWKVNS